MSGAGRKLTIRMPDNPRLRGSTIARLHVDAGMKVAEGSPVLSLSVRGRDHKVRAPRPGRVIPLVAPGDAAIPGDPLYILNVDEEALAEANKSARALVPVEKAKYSEGVTPELIEPIIRSRRPEPEQGPLSRFAGAWGKPVLAIALYVLACFALLPILRAFGHQASWPVLAAMCAGSLMFAALINHLYAPVSGVLARWTVKLVAVSWLVVSGLAIFGPPEVGDDLTLEDVGERVASLWQSPDAAVAVPTEQTPSLAVGPEEAVDAEQVAETQPVDAPSDPQLVTMEQPDAVLVALAAPTSSGVLPGQPLGESRPVHQPPSSSFPSDIAQSIETHGVLVRAWGRIPPAHSASIALRFGEPDGLPSVPALLAAVPGQYVISDLAPEAVELTGTAPDASVFSSIASVSAHARPLATELALPKLGLSPLMDRISTRVARAQADPLAESLADTQIAQPDGQPENIATAGPAMRSLAVLNGEPPVAAPPAGQAFLLGSAGAPPLVDTAEAVLPDATTITERKRLPDSLVNRQFAALAIEVPRNDALPLAVAETDVAPWLHVPRQVGGSPVAAPVTLAALGGEISQPLVPAVAPRERSQRKLPTLAAQLPAAEQLEVHVASVLAGTPDRGAPPLRLGSVMDTDPIAYRATYPGRDGWMIAQAQALGEVSSAPEGAGPEQPVATSRETGVLSVPLAVGGAINPILIETGPALAALSPVKGPGAPKIVTDTLPASGDVYAGRPTTGEVPSGLVREGVSNEAPRIPNPEPAFAERLLLFLYFDDPRATSHPGVGDRWAPQLSPDVAEAVRSAKVEAVREVVQVSSWCDAEGQSGTVDKTAWLNDRIRLLQVRMAVEPTKLAALEAELPVFGDAPPGFFHNLRPLLGGGADAPVMQRAWDYLQAAGGARATYFDKPEVLSRSLTDAGCAEIAWDGDGPANQIGRDLAAKLSR